MKNIMILSFHPLTQKIKNDYYLDELEQIGYSVVFCELGFIYNFPKDIHGTIEDGRRKYFSDLGSFKAFCKSFEAAGTAFIMLMHFDKVTLGLFRFLTRLKVFLVFYATGQFKIVEKLSFNDLTKKPLSTIKRMANRFGEQMLYSIGFIKRYDLVFASGSYCFKKYSRHRTILNINYFDYDNALAVSAAKSMLNGRYIVFLDMYLPFHPDQAILGIEAVDPDIYFCEMNALFSRLEMRYDAKVVIAAHPKSDYSVNPYQGRKIYVNKTAELVRNCQFAVSHSSSSFVYAVINLKPLLLTYSLYLMKVYGKVLMNPMHDISLDLGCPLVNIDETAIGDVLLSVDMKKYQEYKYRFLTSPQTEKTTSVQIVTDYFFKKLESR